MSLFKNKYFPKYTIYFPIFQHLCQYNNTASHLGGVYYLHCIIWL